MASKRKCYFQDIWLQKDEFKEWLASCGRLTDRARCLLCKKSFDVSNMGLSAVTSHMKSSKHISLATGKREAGPLGSQFDLTQFGFTATTHATTDEPVQFCENEVVANVYTDSMATGQVQSGPSLSDQGTQLEVSQSGGRTLQSFVHKDDVTKAEVLWALKSVVSHHSFNSCKDLNDLFKSMFPDSQIASKFQLGPTKLAYVVRFGLAPHFQSELVSTLHECQHLVLAFDESYNKVTQSGQMDLHIRFWNESTGRVCTRYFDSQFLGHATADNLLDAFELGMKSLNVKTVAQISMDGPNVNWSFVDKFKTKFERDPDEPMILDMGSCSLHIVHGAFRTGEKASGFDLEHLLSSLYSLFDGSPARRDDYQQITASSTFPLKFCAHRWVENGRVAERAIIIWPNITKYVSSVVSSKKKPTCRSFTVVNEFVNDSLTIAKLHFFVSTTTHVQRFLTMFQAERPMVPFLCDELQAIVRQVLARYLKPEVLRQADTVAKLCNIDCAKASNHVDSKSVDIGFAAKAALKDAPKTVSDLQKMTFRTGSKQFLVSLTTKLLERNPLKYSVIRSSRCLRPRNLGTDTKKCLNLFEQLLQGLCRKKQFSATYCDQAMTEFRKFCDDVVVKHKGDFMAFKETSEGSLDADRLDIFFARFLDHMDEYKHLWAVCKLCLTLSHGQATVESGFSVNKEILIENQLEDTLIAQRRVYDAVSEAGILRVHNPTSY